MIEYIDNIFTEKDQKNKLKVELTKKDLEVLSGMIREKINFDLTFYTKIYIVNNYFNCSG